MHLITFVLNCYFTFLSALLCLSLSTEVKSLINLDNSVTLISTCVVLAQTPVEAARPWTWGHCACLLPGLFQYHIILLGSMHRCAWAAYPGLWLNSALAGIEPVISQLQVESPITLPLSSTVAFAEANSCFGVVLQQAARAAMMQPRMGISPSAAAAAISICDMPAYNPSARPRMHMMHAGGGPMARPGVPLHSGQMYEAANAAGMQAGNVASVMWRQQSRNVGPHPQNCVLQTQPPMSAYVTQQPRVQCVTQPEWTRFNGHSPYQHPTDRLSQHQFQQLQQRHMVPSSAMLQKQLPTYQHVVDQRLHQDAMVRQAWQQQQQRHLMHPQSVPQHPHYSVAGDPCHIARYRQAASMIPVSGSCVTAVPTVSSAVWCTHCRVVGILW